ncbi:hypothetical protein TB2_023833 [Malus domestica]
MQILPSPLASSSSLLCHLTGPLPPVSLPSFDSTTAKIQYFLNFDRSKLVFFFFNRRQQLELEDLMWALAEISGKESLGAVLNDGSNMAVKRFKDAVVVVMAV